MTARAVRNVNINMRTTPQEKMLLQKAAELVGFSNLTNFIMTAARKEANRVLSDTKSTYLSAKDWELVNQLIKSPPTSREKAKAAYAE